MLDIMTAVYTLLAMICYTASSDWDFEFKESWYQEMVSFAFFLFAFGALMCFICQAYIAFS